MSKYFFSVVEEMVQNPEYKGWRGGRIEVYEKGKQYAVYEARFFFDEKFMDKFREVFDFKESDKPVYIEWDMNGNPRSLKEKIGWLAGIIDGEGYVGFEIGRDTRKYMHNRKFFRPRLQIVNTDRAIIIKAKEICEQLGAKVWVRERFKNSLRKNKQYEVGVDSMKGMIKLLSLTFNNLTGKKQTRAKFVLEFCRSRLSRKAKKKKKGSGLIKPYTKHEISLVKQCVPLQRRKDINNKKFKEVDD